MISHQHSTRSLIAAGYRKAYVSDTSTRSASLVNTEPSTVIVIEQKDGVPA